MEGAEIIHWRVAVSGDDMAATLVLGRAELRLGMVSACIASRVSSTRVRYTRSYSAVR